MPPRSKRKARAAAKKVNGELSASNKMQGTEETDLFDPEPERGPEPEDGSTYTAGQPVAQSTAEAAPQSFLNALADAALGLAQQEQSAPAPWYDPTTHNPNGNIRGTPPGRLGQYESRYADGGLVRYNAGENHEARPEDAYAGTFHSPDGGRYGPGAAAVQVPVTRSRAKQITFATPVVLDLDEPPVQDYVVKEGSKRTVGPSPLKPRRGTKKPLVHTQRSGISEERPDASNADAEASFSAAMAEIEVEAEAEAARTYCATLAYRQPSQIIGKRNQQKEITPEPISAGEPFEFTVDDSFQSLLRKIAQAASTVPDCITAKSISWKYTGVKGSGTPIINDVGLSQFHREIWNPTRKTKKKESGIVFVIDRPKAIEIVRVPPLSFSLSLHALIINTYFPH